MLKYFWLWALVCRGWIGAAEPDALYLTWVDDPTTTMTVVWHAKTEAVSSMPRVMYHPVADARWMSKVADAHPVAETTACVYVARIESLKSDATYVFKIEGSRKEFRFRTLPNKLTRPVKIVMGGDIAYYWGEERVERMNRAVAYDNPDFVILGGDLAYTTGTKRSTQGRQWEIERWQEFFRIVQKSMMAPEGRMIPLVPVVGNHDVHRRKMQRPYPDIFYTIFPFPEPLRAYRALAMGDYLKLVLLDTGHTSPIEGEQTAWLKTTLENDKTPYLFSVYHVGAYPSVYKYKGEVPELLRTTWVPLFEQAGISGAFEHHSHALKRTFPLKEGKKDPRGVIYFGDGSWGVPPRKVHTPAELWYLEMSQAVNACWFIHLSKNSATVEARTSAGVIKDRVTLFPRVGGK